LLDNLIIKDVFFHPERNSFLISLKTKKTLRKYSRDIKPTILGFKAQTKTNIIGV
jgi:hypothetical protein